MRRARACLYCGASAGAQLYPVGVLCGVHAPPAPPVPDPTRTAEALRRRRALVLRAARRTRAA